MAEETIHPNRSRNFPADPVALEQARERQLGAPVGNAEAVRTAMQEVPTVEVNDKRSMIALDAPASQSADSPPEIGTLGQPAPPPASFDPAMRYYITLNVPVEYAGRWLRPVIQHLVTGDVANTLIASVATSEDFGPIVP